MISILLHIKTKSCCC